MSNKLWELSDDLREFESLIDEIIESDLSEDEKQARLDYLFNEYMTLDEQFDKKCEATACYIRRLEALTEARKNEAKRLRELADSSERQANKLREYLLLNMMINDKSKIEGKSVKLSIRPKPGKVCLRVDPKELPPEFQRTKIEGDLNAIKEHLKSNPSCNFAYISNGEYSLFIK